MIITDGVHLISTESLEELHEFAIHSLQFKKEWFQWHNTYPHYDLTTSSAKKRALKEGATLVDGLELVRALKETPYLHDFWRESVQQYEGYLTDWLSKNFPQHSIQEIATGKQINTFSVNGVEKKVFGLYKNVFFKENGFWRSFRSYETKKRKLKLLEQKSPNG